MNGPEVQGMIDDYTILGGGFASYLAVPCLVRVGVDRIWIPAIGIDKALRWRRRAEDG